MSPVVVVKCLLSLCVGGCGLAPWRDKNACVTELYPGTSTWVLAVSSVLKNQQCVLIKVSKQKYTEYAYARAADENVMTRPCVPL